jgi:hypothetical protein
LDKRVETRVFRIKRDAVIRTIIRAAFLGPATAVSTVTAVLITRAAAIAAFAARTASIITTAALRTWTST